MVSWLLGLEESFSKSLLYVLFLFSALTLFGSTAYLALVGGPMLINKLISSKPTAPLE